MNLIDRFICEVDSGLRTVYAPAHAERPLPAASSASFSAAASRRLHRDERNEAARLMRVNHTGEVCAQALYQGQALVAKTNETRELLRAAAREEHDHLAWCEARLNSLGGATSRLSPLFYAGSFGLGIVSGLLGDKWSLGFLVETERQVEAHLGDHLNRWPIGDRASFAVLEAMQADELRHGQTGLSHGGAPLPVVVQGVMRAFSKVMTATSYRI